MYALIYNVWLTGLAVAFNCDVTPDGAQRHKREVDKCL